MSLFDFPISDKNKQFVLSLLVSITSKVLSISRFLLCVVLGISIVVNP